MAAFPLWIATAGVCTFAHSKIQVKQKRCSHDSGFATRERFSRFKQTGQVTPVEQLSSIAVPFVRSLSQHLVRWHVFFSRIHFRQHHRAQFHPGPVVRLKIIIFRSEREHFLLTRPLKLPISSLVLISWWCTWLECFVCVYVMHNTGGTWCRCSKFRSSCPASSSSVVCRSRDFLWFSEAPGRTEATLNGLAVEF